MTEFSKVTQADREAAADLALAMQMDATAYIVRKGKGDADTQPLTQAFARHRIAALSAALDGIASLESDAKLAADSLGNSGSEFRSCEDAFRIIQGRARTVADKLRRGE